MDAIPARTTRTERAAAARRETRRRHQIAVQLAAPYDGVVTYAMLYEAGLTRGQVRVAIERGIWHPVGKHTVSITSHQPTGRALWWCAVWESGASAVLDGTTALLAAGLKNWSTDLIEVTVAHNRRVRSLAGVRHHFLRDRGEIIPAGIPRTRPDLAVVRAAQWAVTDRQAATIIAMAVQQRIVHPTALLARWEKVGYSHRRQVLDSVIADVCNGAQSLAELDFAAMCHKRGLPEPGRQVVRSGSHGRVYLDVFWDEFNLHVEIQGAQHFQGTAGVDDALRFNDLALGNSDMRSLQIPVLGLRICPDKFLDQVARAVRELRQAG